MIKNDLLRVACGLTTDWPSDINVPLDATCEAVENLLSQKLGNKTKICIVKHASDQIEISTLLKEKNAFILSGNVKKETPQKIRFNVEFITQQLNIVDEFNIEDTVQNVRQKYHLNVEDNICIERGKLLNDVKLKDIATHSNTLYITSDFGQPTLVIRNVKTRDEKDHVIFVPENGTLRDVARQFVEIYGMPEGKNPVFVYTDPITKKSERLFLSCDVNRVNPDGRLVISFGTPSAPSTPVKPAAPNPPQGPKPKSNTMESPKPKPVQGEPKPKPVQEEPKPKPVQEEPKPKPVHENQEIPPREEGQPPREEKEEHKQKEEKAKEEAEKPKEKEAEKEIVDDNPIANEMVVLNITVDKTQIKERMEVRKGITVNQLQEMLAEKHEEIRGNEYTVRYGLKLVRDPSLPLYKQEKFEQVIKKGEVSIKLASTRRAPQVSSEFFLSFVAGSNTKKLAVDPSQTWESVRPEVMRAFKINPGNKVRLILKGVEVTYTETIAERNVESGQEVLFSVEEEDPVDPVKQVVEATMCDTETAMKYLKVYNTTESAINAILDGKPLSEEKPTSDESAEALAAACGCSINQAKTALLKANGDPNAAYDILTGQKPTIRIDSQADVDIIIEQMSNLFKNNGQEDKIPIIFAAPDKILQFTSLSEAQVKAIQDRAIELGLTTPEIIESVRRNIKEEEQLNNNPQTQIIETAMKEFPDLDREVIVDILKNVSYDYEKFKEIVG